MEALDCIMSRRSVRFYLSNPIEKEKVDTILQAAICAPSGKNGQPWKFKVVTDKETIEQISKFTVLSRWMKNAPCVIFVWLDKNLSYDYTKDCQSCGASIQNILLAANSLSLGSCWIGEIVANADKVKEILNISDVSFELMAAISLGYPPKVVEKTARKDIESFLI